MPTIRIGSWLQRKNEGSEGDILTPEDANARYGITDVLNFDKPISSSVAQTLNEDKQQQLIRQNTIRNGPGGVINRTLTAVAGAAPSFLDPINYAAAFIPGLGESRIAMVLGRAAARAEGFGLESVADGLLSAEGLNRRVGAALSSNLPGRVIQGASQGAAGMAALEPLNFYLDRDEHNDWSMGQALGNIAFGGFMGGSLHGLGYALGKRLDRAGTDAKGQVLADGMSSMASDSPSNAESLLNIHEVQKTREDLDRAMSEHGDTPDIGTGSDENSSASEGNEDGAPEAQQYPPLRDRISSDLSDIKKSHAETLDESALYEKPNDTQNNVVSAEPVRIKKTKNPPSLFTFLNRYGGVIDQGGDLRGQDIHRQRIGLIRRRGGMPLDDARSLAIQHGYLKPDADINDLINAMVEESHGRKVFPDGQIFEKERDFAALDDHYREIAADDADEASYNAGISLTPEEHRHAIEAILSGIHPDAAIEEAMMSHRHSTWDRYADMMDEGRAFHMERIGTKQMLLHSIARQRLGLYAKHLDSDIDNLSLYDLAESILKHDSSDDAVEHALRLIENGKGKGHDASSWQETVQEAYQAAHQRLDELQQGAAEAIMRNLHGYEDHEVTQSRAGLSAHKEAAPSPETGQDVSPLPTGGIEHLDLSAAGNHPDMIWHMPAGMKDTPAWPTIIADGKHTVRLNKEGIDIGGGHGRLHIEARHGNEIRALGFTSVDDFVRHVLGNATEIRQDRPKRNNSTGSYVIANMGGKYRRKKPAQSGCPPSHERGWLLPHCHGRNV
ncbi:hypothetical protein AL01_01085 [Bombella intestini]|uniref:Uncharacterized protein n=1 Tax=Bombella intestini TaxID=1539051 RepID=A0A1S8GRB5_9PROT|nr:hypothetical protein [Bombella intestini]OOL19607.1 hypothetical protein AL01_01085 [Bombella intestini]